MSTKYTVVTVALNQSPAQLAAKLNELFLVAGAIDLQWIRHRSRSNVSSTNAELEVVYNDPGGLNYAAAAFVGTAAASAQTLANAYLVANSTFKVVQVLDISNTTRRSVFKDAVILISAEQLESRCDQATRLWPAIPDANIAVGASGTVQIVTVSGANPTPVVTVTNRGQFAWPAGEIGWILKEPGACEWVGYSTCCDQLWTPAYLPSLMAWYDADDATTLTSAGGSVSSWADKSGNARDATQATGANQPTTGTRQINGRNTLDFASDVMSTDSFFIDTNNFSVFSVQERDSGDGNAVGSDTGGLGVRFFQSLLRATPGYTAILFDGGLAKVATINGPYTKAVTGFVSDGVEITPRGNGTAGVPVAASGLNAGSVPVHLGARSPSKDSPFDGAIGEIVLAEALTLSDTQKLEGYLAWKWGLQGDLPVGHPYKLAPPTI